MAELEFVGLDEAGLEIEAPQSGDTYVSKRDVSIEGDLAVSGTVDGRDVAADGALLDTATQPSDDLSTLTNDILANQSEAEIGSENTKIMTSLRVSQALLAQTAKNKDNATSAPGPTNDDTEGYEVGSRWTDTTGLQSYVCLDPTTNTAVWASTTIGLENAIAQLAFTPVAAPAHLRGKVYYDEVAEALSYYNEESDVTVNIGQEFLIRVRNNTGGTIVNGQVCKITGVASGFPTIEKSLAVEGASDAVGIATHDIETSSFGYITGAGKVNDIDTSAFSAGDPMYLSDSVAGAMQNTKPNYPIPTVQMGVCIESDIATGSMLVEITHDPGTVEVHKSYTFVARDVASGIAYQGGFYEAPAADTTLTQASLTQTLGSALVAYGAHAFLVAAGNGTTDGSDLVITITGTSIDENGVRNGGDSEVIDANADSSALNAYFETTKKWIGQITFTLSSTGGGTYSCDFNYGFCKYDDFGDVDYTLRTIECVGVCDSTDTGFNFELLHHKITGWTYHATAFVPGTTPLESWVDTYVTETKLLAGQPFAMKLTELTHVIAALAATEGVLIRTTTSVNTAIAYMDAHITITVP